MRVVIDTGVFFHPEALGMMPYFLADLVVPAIVFAERARQLARDGGDVPKFRRFLDDMNAIIEPFSETEAQCYAISVDDTRWARLARDAMIAGHVRDGDRLFTTNPRDFVELGMPPTQIVEIPMWAARDRARAAAN